ncbi:MAG TPA: riboflavin synthase [Casimicrobiaceae bacterium]|nr:riboflavin synthase [Casimicrobiaceae bacterium]
MFTGIVQAVGQIVASEGRGGGARITVDTGTLDVGDVAIGESIAVAGCCLTVVARNANRLSFDVSAETLSCTTGLDGHGAVNLERALRLSDRLGGHLLAGHVDGVGTVVRSEAVSGGDGSRILEAEAPESLARFIAPKGSIAIDGVSLTVNTVSARRFAVNLIPHTLAATTLGELTPGARANLEVDLVARYIARLQEG